MFEDLLVPTDGSQDMDPVVDRAIEFATMCDAAVHALHVIDDRAYQSVPDDARHEVRDALESDGNSATKHVARQGLESDVETTREVRWGNPPAAILAYAAENDVGCIVMGTHGRTGYERYLLGSVAEKVVRASPVPVFTVPVGEETRELVEFPA